MQDKQTVTLVTSFDRSLQDTCKQNTCKQRINQEHLAIDS